jgi:putative ABC transport system permease protein
MKFAFLVLRNTFRNRRRTILTVLSIGMSLFLISTLKTIVDELEDPVMTPDSAKRLMTRHATGLGNTMPIAHKERIRQIPGVEQVAAAQWFGGVYKDPANFFAQFAIDAEHFGEIYPDYVTETPQQLEDFVKLRTGALAGVNLAKRFGWKVGDKITLEGAIFPIDPELTITGLIQGGGSESTFYFHWDYFNELAPMNIAGIFIVKAANTDEIPAISESVDATFASTAAPTKTESEAAFALSIASMFGNVRLLVLSISTVVLFTVILVAANTMAMSIRERTGEIAILRTLGFAPGRVLGMMIAESILIAVAGGLGGALVAKVIFRSMDMTSLSGGIISGFTVRWSTVALSLGISLVVATFSTLVPAYAASRLPISVAVRRRGE